MLFRSNIRQLRNVLRYACAMCESTRVEMRHVPPDIAALLVTDGDGRPAPDANGSDERGERAERIRIIEALTRHQWRPNAAALALGISRATLYRRIARLKISGPHRA